jgi:hypothetical protein
LERPSEIHYYWWPVILHSCPDRHAHHRFNNEGGGSCGSASGGSGSGSGGGGGGGGGGGTSDNDGSRWHGHFYEDKHYHRQCQEDSICVAEASSRACCEGIRCCVGRGGGSIGCSRSDNIKRDCRHNNSDNKANRKG